MKEKKPTKEIITKSKEEKESVNFMQVGRTVKCGHCHFMEFSERLKQAEEMAKRIGQTYKCDCICHV
jgi:hypothetical protein